MPDLESQSTSYTFCLIREEKWRNKEGKDRTETVGQKNLRLGGRREEASLGL